MRRKYWVLLFCFVIATALGLIVLVLINNPGSTKVVQPEVNNFQFGRPLPLVPKNLKGDYCDQLRQYVPQTVPEATEWALRIVKGKNIKNRVFLQRVRCADGGAAIFGFRVDNDEGEVEIIIPHGGIVFKDVREEEGTPVAKPRTTWTVYFLEQKDSAPRLAPNSI